MSEPEHEVDEAHEQQTDDATAPAADDSSHQPLIPAVPPPPIVDAVPSQRNATKPLLIGGAVVLAFAAVIAIGQQFINKTETPLTGGKPAASATAAPTAPAPPTERADIVMPNSALYEDSALVLRDPNDVGALGDINAPIVLTEWTDLRCPYCGAFTLDTLPTIIQEYVDTGQVRIEIATVAMFGEESFKAAVAVQAAGRQGKFYEYMTTVYADAPAGGKPDMPREKLIRFAEQAGVPDIAQFTADLDDPVLHEKVEKETKFAQDIGVNSVPFFLAGKISVPGAQPIEAFREYLDHFELETELPE